MAAEGKWGAGPFLYVWLAISMLLNVSGMASIVDGFVVWAGFVGDAVGLYKQWIRAPVLWAAHLLWPAGWPRIPGWVVDWLCVTGSFLVAANIENIRSKGRSVFAEDYALGGLGRAVGTSAFALVLGPLVLPIVLLADRKLSDDSRRILQYWLMLLGVVLLLMFLNWQLKRAGIW